jgi:hypothetical protein
MLYECLSHSFCSHILAQFQYYFLVKTICNYQRFVQSSLDSRSTTKSMNIFCQMCFDTGKGFKKPCQQSFQLLFIHICHNSDRMYRHSVAFQVKRTVVIRVSVTFLFECSVIVESCVYWISSVQRDSEKDTQCLLWKSNFSSSLKKHSVMNILTFKTVRNDLCCLQIVWQSSLYNSSSASAFTHICLRSVISLNKFWSHTSTEISMSATVIKAVCIDLLIISDVSSASYNVVLCHLRDSLFCFCLDRA